MMKQNIAIVGATGKTGIPLIKYLSKNNILVKAMLHNVENNPFSAFPNVTTQVADFYDDKSLDLFFKNCDKVFLVTPALPNMAEIAIKTAKIAIENGVSHIVKLSALGSSVTSTVNLLKQHAFAEEEIKAMNVESTFIHPHFFLENLLQDAATIKKIDAIYSPLGNTAIAPVSVEDIAAVVATILTQGNHHDKTYQLTGNKAFTQIEYAKELSQLLNQEIHYYAVPFEAVYQNMLKNGMPEWLAKDLIELMQSWSQPKSKLVTSDVEKITGRPAIGLTEFLTQHINVYKREHQTYNDY